MTQNCPQPMTHIDPGISRTRRVNSDRWSRRNSVPEVEAVQGWSAEAGLKPGHVLRDSSLVGKLRQGDVLATEVFQPMLSDRDGCIPMGTETHLGFSHYPLHPDQPARAQSDWFGSD